MVGPGESSAMRFILQKLSSRLQLFNEVLTPVRERVSILASYTSDYYAGKPAVSLHQFGDGRVIYFGSFFTPENVTALLNELAIHDPLAAWAEIPAEFRP